MEWGKKAIEGKARIWETNVPRLSVLLELAVTTAGTFWREVFFAGDRPGLVVLPLLPSEGQGLANSGHVSGSITLPWPPRGWIIPGSSNGFVCMS